MRQKPILRILDANFNRSREGLRVCEDVARFILEDQALTRGLKSVRHAISDCLKGFSMPVRELVASRDTASDAGRGACRLEKDRSGACDIFLANLERAKESLRVLEEMSKLLDKRACDRFKRLRFKLYAIEKKSLPILEALRHHGS